MSGDSKILQTGCRRSCSLLRLVDARGSCCRSEEDVRREREDARGRERTPEDPYAGAQSHVSLT